MTKPFEQVSTVDAAFERVDARANVGGVSAANQEIQDGLKNFAEVQQTMRGPDTSGLHPFGLTSDFAQRGPLAGAEMPVADRPPKIDYRASIQFRNELPSAAQTVKEQMPNSVRAVLEKVQFQPVRSIDNDPRNGALYDYTGNPYKIKVSEIGTRNGLESVLKHEYGHAFDFLSARPPLSDNPQFRKLVDQGIQPGSRLAMEKRNNPRDFYAEVFGDLFARNLNAPARDLSIPEAARLTAAQDWVRAKMYRR